MSQADHERAQHYALDRLSRELSPVYVYHSLRHTRDEVLAAATSLAAHEGVGTEESQLLRTAACYHDLGFLEQAQNHELIGAAMAVATLPSFGYSTAQIALVQGMILATRLPQMPRTPLERLLADADLDILGRANFLARNSDLRGELAAIGAPFSDLAWYTSQINFLQSHTYWTATMRRLRNRQKRRNIASLQALQAACL